MDNGGDVHERMAYRRPNRVCRHQGWKGNKGIAYIGLYYLPRAEISIAQMIRGGHGKNEKPRQKAEGDFLAQGFPADIESPPGDNPGKG